MSIVVNHRVNTIEKLKSTPKECGVEIDLRPYCDRVILHHEPFEDGENFEDFLEAYDHRLLILNVKSEGIEEKVLQIVNKFNIENYFFLDVTPPFMFKMINKGISEMAVRFSEFESIETCLNLKNKVDWVFIDNLTRLPVENNSFHILKEYFKLCIVSPELLHRDEVEETKRLLEDNPVDAVLTDNIQGWF